MPDVVGVEPGTVGQLRLRPSAVDIGGEKPTSLAVTIETVDGGFNSTWSKWDIVAGCVI